MKFAESIAALIGQPIVARDIEANGVTQTFYFRKLSGEDADQLLLEIMGDDNRVDRAKMKGNIGRQVAACLCDEQGNAVATPEEINALPVDLRNKFEAIVTEVNGGAEKKPSPDESASGTS